MDDNQVGWLLDKLDARIESEREQCSNNRDHNVVIRRRAELWAIARSHFEHERAKHLERVRLPWRALRKEEPKERE